MDEPAWHRLPGVLRSRIEAFQPEAELYEIRLRTGRPIHLTGRTENRLCGDALPHGEFRRILAALMEYSLYAWEDELARGYFTTRQGFRIGVAGKYRMVEGKLRLPDVYSLCIRLAKAVPGSADPLMKALNERSCLILSPPGCGKTTLLRDAARQLSAAGKTVALLDERCEIAAAWNGVPAMDVGDRCDIVESVDKPTGIPMIVRALAPQVLVTDELGSAADADAVADAMRCGVQVIATAHASDFRDAQRRHWLAPLLADGFAMIAELGMPPGTIRVLRVREGITWHELSGDLV